MFNLLFIYRYMRPAAALTDSSGILHDHILSQIEIIDPGRATLSPSPPKPPHKGKRKKKGHRKEMPIPSPPERKNAGNYSTGGPGPPSSPSSPEPAPSTSSGATLLALMHPTLVLPKKASTASVDFSFHNHLPEEALGCFHPLAFPNSGYECVLFPPYVIAATLALDYEIVNVQTKDVFCSLPARPTLITLHTSDNRMRRAEASQIMGEPAPLTLASQQRSGTDRRSGPRRDRTPHRIPVSS